MSTDPSTQTNNAQSNESTGTQTEQPKGLMEQFKDIGKQMKDLGKQAMVQGKQKLQQAEKDLNKAVIDATQDISGKAQNILDKNIPQNMYDLIRLANVSLEGQLQTIQTQLNELKEKNIIIKNLQNLSDANALIFVTTGSIKLGASIGYGEGIVIHKLSDGSWSQPCAIRTPEVGVGWQIGASRTRYVIPLTTKDQIDALLLSDRGQQISLNGRIGFAWDKEGRVIRGTIGGSDKSVSKNAFDQKLSSQATVAANEGFDIGLGVELSTIQVHKNKNEYYYYNYDSNDLKMSKILDGTIKSPTEQIISDDEMKEMNESEQTKIINRNEIINKANSEYAKLIALLAEVEEHETDVMNVNAQVEQQQQQQQQQPMQSQATSSDQTEGDDNDNDTTVVSNSNASGKE